MKTIFQMLRAIDSDIESGEYTLSSEALTVLSKLESFIMDAPFSKSEIIKGICRNYRLKNAEMMEKLVADGVFKKTKSMNTLRHQLSCINANLTEIFGKDIDTAFYAQYYENMEVPTEELNASLKRINTILDAFSLDFDTDFTEHIVENIASDPEVNPWSSQNKDLLKELRDGTLSFGVEELTDEIRFLKTYSTNQLFKAEDSLDKRKLAYIFFVMNKRVFGLDTKNINLDKVDLLTSFYSLEMLPLDDETAVFSSEATYISDENRFSKNLTEHIQRLQEENEKLTKELELTKNEIVLLQEGNVSKNVTEDDSTAVSFGLLSTKETLELIRSITNKVPNPDEEYHFSTTEDIEKVVKSFLRFYTKDGVLDTFKSCEPIRLRALLEKYFSAEFFLKDGEVDET